MMQTYEMAAVYSRLADRYDGSRRAEPAIVAALNHALSVMRARTVLEIGAGTGNYSAELASWGFQIVAVERAAEMLKSGRAKAPVRWILADAQRLPLRSGALDAAVAVNVLHHLEDLAAALGEMRRVVRIGVALQAVVRENLETLWYCHYFPEMERLLLPLHPRLGAAICALLRAGFERVAFASVFYSGAGDLTFESARTRPELLFDPDFRAATSGFRRLSHEGVERGLAALARDLESGKFAEVRARYESAHAAVGDCVVLRAGSRA